MKKFLMYLCYCLAPLGCIHGLLLTAKMEHMGEALPFYFVNAAILIRLGYVIGKDSEQIAWWKRLLIGLAKMIVCMIIGVVLSTILFDGNQMVANWIASILIIIAIVWLRSVKILGWFNKSTKNKAESN